MARPLRARPLPLAWRRMARSPARFPGLWRSPMVAWPLRARPSPLPPPPSRPSGWRGPARRARHGLGSALRAAMAAHPPVVGPAPALRAAWRGGAARLPPARPRRPAPPARRPACPRLGATLRPPYPPRRRGLPVRDRDPTRPTPDVLRSPARHGLLAWLGRDVAAWRAPWHPSSLAAARTTCSWRPRSCVRQWSAAPFAHSRSLLARTTLNHHA
jgi:hypothetical protein